MSDNDIKRTIRQICINFAENITQYADFYNGPLNTHQDYATYMIETITEEYSKVFQELLKYKNIEVASNSELAPEKPYVQV